ncbi:MAG: 30S ribosomal protein S9 [Planctomycetes bacterium]|jgi:small subunit ribosomal protein S9|nr:30S ribosomal protein S9 [Planctomycetota bacterium]
MSVQTPFIFGLGRRKSSVARVRVKSGSGKFVVNKKPLDEYFTTLRDQNLARAPLSLLESVDYDITVRVHGGGAHGQAGAVQLGVARALKDANPTLFEGMRENGFLTRDSRMKERKKPGRRGARRGFQFSKR